MEKVAMIEDQCSDESDKKNRNKKKLEDAEGRSQDPFVRKKMLVQEKIAETREHITSRSDLLNKGGKGSVETVKSNAQIRKDLKELVEMKSELVRVHEEEEKKALKKAKTKPGKEETVQKNLAKRKEIIDVIQENIDDLKYQEKNPGGGAEAAGGAGRSQLMGGPQQRAKVSRPKAPQKDLTEMDAGSEGLDSQFLQIQKNDQELDQELDLVHQGVKRLGIMAQDMNTELKIQNAMIQETKAKADSVNENLLMTNKRMKEALDKSGGGMKWCMNMICLVILLAVVGYIYKLVA